MLRKQPYSERFFLLSDCRQNWLSTLLLLVNTLIYATLSRSRNNKECKKQDEQIVPTDVDPAAVVVDLLVVVRVMLAPFRCGFVFDNNSSSNNNTFFFLSQQRHDEIHYLWT